MSTLIVINLIVKLTHYRKLPQIYQYDDFSACRTRYTDFVYCVATTKLLPDETNELWNNISFLSSNRRNFPHDKLENGICVNDHHVGAIDDTKLGKIVGAHVSITIYNKYGLQSHTDIESCWRNSSMNQELATSEKVFLYISLSLFLISIYATWKDYKGVISGDLIAAFSIRQNFHRLTKTNSTNALPFLEGLRVIGTMTILVVHSQLPMIRMPIKNTEDLEAQANHFVFPFINSANTHMIQFFFALGGMVFGLSCLNHFDSCSAFHGLYFVEKLVRRLIRILPVYSFVIFYHATWYKRVKRGPLEFKFYDYCSEHWWTNVLFINNYVLPTKPCLQYGWYLGADLHLFLISSSLLMLVWRFPRTKQTIAAIMAIVAFAVPAFVIYNNSTAATMTFDMRHALAELRTYKHFIEYYLPSHTNVSGYFFGVIAAMTYKGAVAGDHQNRVQTVLQRAFATCTIALVGLNAFTTVLPLLDLNPHLSIFHAVYGSLLKASWGLSYGLLFLVLGLKRESLLVDFLSHPLMHCLAKLSYCIYIAQYSVIYGVYTNFPIPLIYGTFNLIILTSATVFLSLVSAFLLYMAVEAPFGYLGNKCLSLFIEKGTIVNTQQNKHKKRQ
ncbi:regulator of hypoxia-inducible factor 1-like [Anopheles coustani]|uniref:regulator of hypoxia-inducible factor 1-like n=1 Tax=Anopheles coustani TaxID=139045 RepID=UPI002658ABA4|nr:regulator of hypoxia-inducible factor 1-like [Anopheles coustani]